MHVQDEVRNAFMLRHVRIGAREQHSEIRQVRLTGPHLLAVDDVVLAVLETLPVGFGAQTSQVRSGVGLGIQLAPDLVGAENLWDVATLLFLSAVHDKRRSDEADAQAVDAARHTHARHFFADDRLFYGPRCLTAVFLGPAHADKAGFVELAMPRTPLLVALERARPMLLEPCS